VFNFYSQNVFFFFALKETDHLLIYSTFMFGGDTLFYYGMESLLNFMLDV